MRLCDDVHVIQNKEKLSYMVRLYLLHNVIATLILEHLKPIQPIVFKGLDRLKRSDNEYLTIKRLFYGCIIFMSI